MTAGQVRTLVRLLHWSAPLTKQNLAVAALPQMEPEHYPLLFDWKNKPRWKNTVKVIEAIGFPKNEPLLSNLFELLRDTTWPGAQDAVRVLCGIERTYLLPQLEAYARLAAQDGQWLEGLRLLAETAGLTAGLSPEAARLLAVELQ